MSMSRAVTALGCLAAFTLGTPASIFTKAIFLSVIYTIGRVDWSARAPILRTALADEIQVDDKIKLGGFESTNIIQASAVEHVSLGLEGNNSDDNHHACVLETEENGHDDFFAALEYIALPEFMDAESRSRSSSLSATSSIFDNIAPNDRAASPDTEISVDSDDTVSHTPTTNIRITNISLPVFPMNSPTALSQSWYRHRVDNAGVSSSPAINSSPLNKYSFKCEDLANAVEDFSSPVPVAAPKKDFIIATESPNNNGKQGHDTTHDDLIINKRLLSRMEKNTPSKKEKQVAPRRRRQALRQASRSESSLLANRE